MIRIVITIAIIAVFRVLSYIPIPLFDTEWIKSQQSFGTGFLGILNSYSGQALSRFSILALGISPFITASIAVQLMQTVIGPMKEWQEQGEEGRHKAARVTRYLALIMALAQALLLVVGAGSKGSQLKLGVDSSFLVYFYMALVVTAGSAVTIWMADLITAKGIGNGTSIMIAVGIMTSIPIMVDTLNSKYLGVDRTSGSIALYVTILVLYVAMLLFVVYMQIATRKIPTKYANRQGKSDSHIPIKLNTAGVLPVIFASTILSIPLTIIGFTGTQASDTGLSTAADWINMIFNYQKPIGFIIYIILIVVFSFFYTFMTTDPNKIADNLQQSNAIIPGIRPGEDTKNFIAKLIFKVTVLGTAYLVLVAAMPIVISWIFAFTAAEASAITIGGTGLLIIVGVAVETTSQLENQANQDEYQGLF